MSIVRALRLVAGYISLPESARAELEGILGQLEIPEPTTAEAPAAPPATTEEIVSAPASLSAEPAEPVDAPAPSEEAVSPGPDPSGVDAASSEPVNPQITS